MRKIKKFAGLALAGTMSMALLAGCGNGVAGAATTKATTAAETTEAAAAETTETATEASGETTEKKR